MLSHFRLQEVGGSLIPVDVFASDVAKMLPGSNFPKVSEARNAKTLAGIKISSKFVKILASMGSAGAIVAQILGILEKFDPCQCFRISSFRDFGEI